MPEIPTQPQPNPTQKSINWKRILIVSVIGAVVIGLGVLIFLILQPKEETTTPVTTKKATPSAKISTPSAEKDKTSDWKGYTSNKGKFSIKYPAAFKLVDMSARFPKKVTYIKFESSDYEYTQGEGSPEPTVTKGGYMLVVVNFHEDVNTLDEIIQSVEVMFDYYKKVEKYSARLGGQEAVRLVYYGPSPLLALSNTMERTYSIDDRGVDYRTEVRYLSENKESIGIIFQQMLNTFKFLD